MGHHQPTASEPVQTTSTTPVYLDHAATTPVDPEVVQAMVPVLLQTYGNPSSSSHRFGREAAAAVEAGRASVAALLGAQPEEVLFTSGATEANLLALTGLVRVDDATTADTATRSRHVVAGAAEHRSVLAALEVLERGGVEVTRVAPRRDGRTHVEDVLAAVRDDTVLVTLMWVNNETGVINPIPDLGAALRTRHPHVLLHSDATQAVGKIPVDVAAAHVDALSASAHKLHGPKGVGALYLRTAVRPRLVPLMRGGGQEGGLRGGTPDVAGIVGFGTAATLAAARLTADMARLRRLRDRLVEALRRSAPELVVHGDAVERVPGISSVVLPGVRATAVIARVGEDVAVSAGSACSGGGTDISHVLSSMGVSEADARSTLRVSLGRTTTAGDVDTAAAAIGDAVRALSADRPSAATPVDCQVRPPGFAVEPIGWVRSPVADAAYISWGAVRSRIVVDPRVRAALDGLDGYSHVVVVTWLHEVTTSTLRHVPQGRVLEVPETGIFGCRCAYRPNPIGTTTVQLVAIEGDEVVVQGLDAIDGTPVLDLKPYTPQVDAPVGEVRVPDWVHALTY